MTSSIGLWLKSALTHIASRMAYRGEYFISLISMFVLELVGPIFTYIIYYNSPGFAGWTFYQVLLLQGIFLTVKGFSFMSFLGIIWNSNITLQRGEFDLTLIKPRNPLFMFICQSFDAEDTAKFVGGVLLSLFAIFHIPAINWTGLLIGLVAMMLGVGFFFSMALFFSSFIFRFIRSMRVYDVLEIIAMIGNYPKSIYPKLAGTLFTAMLPIFIVAAIPAKAILGEVTIDILISGISVIVLVALALYTWFSTIKKYSSAGG
jgi:ABC-2 type transport system permease protein